jgi:predicted nucleotidyltransferase
MLSAGIICEYNPLHPGHAELIERTRRAGATHMAAVMCGNFVQRGEPAVLSKWARARQALASGIDLVVELPLPWAVAGAEKFAMGGVFLLDAMGADLLSFGSECGSAERLEHAAGLLLSPKMKTALRASLNRGETFARARQKAVGLLAGAETEALLREPNNILGIEYLKAKKRLGSGIRPFTVKRAGAAHDADGAGDEIASASQIRRLIFSGGDYACRLSAPCAAIVRREIDAGRAPAGLAPVERAVLAKLRGMGPRELAALPDISEGLENRIGAAVRKARSLEELYLLVKSKRYTHARIRRIVLSAFLGLDASMGDGVPPYLRVLAINEKGREILRQAKEKAKIPIITNSSDILFLDSSAKNMLELECRATDLYALCMPKAGPCGLDRTEGIITACRN